MVPRSEEAARGAIAIAASEGVPILPRGAGSSQCGQAVGEALVIDHTKYLNRVLAIDAQAAVAVVQPGIVLDALNAQLRPHGLWFPVDVSTSAQATIGGMAGNNSCGSRSIAYGNMVHNVARDRSRAPSTASAGRFGPDATDALGSARVRRVRATACERFTSAKRAEIEAALSQGPAQGRRLQPRPSWARRTPTLRICSSARKARSPTPSACT